ncbi:MAG TPA: response regulator [Chthoniobacteraceae bacterium]
MLETPLRDMATLREMRILLVDDEPLNVALLDALLGDEGFTQVRSITDSRKVVAVCSEFVPDLILLDLMMPHLDGFAVMQRLAVLREPDEFMPIMVLTADITESTKKRALSAGATDFLTKPFDRTEAVLRISNLLRTRRMHVAIAAQNEQLEQKVSERTAKLEETLVELRATQQQVVQRERLSALGAMVTGIAHDFNNSLALILGYGELLQRECRRLSGSRDLTDYAQTIITAALDAAGTVSRLREFHRPSDEGGAQVPVSLSQLAEQSVAFTRPRWEAESHARGLPIEIHTECMATPPISGQAAELREMLTNLIFNAVDAMPQGGTITLRTYEGIDSVVLEVTDTGVGMTEEVRRRCLEPFFTTKGARGSGLGLAMVYGTVQRHRGEVEIESKPGRGTTFQFTFPIDTSGEQAVDTPDVAAPKPLRILVVDDQPVLCEVLAESLTRDWHTVEVATNGREALEKFEAGEFDLVITDKAMPEMNGDQLAAAVKVRRPEVKVVMLTGFGEFEEGEEIESEFIDFLLPKPATMVEVRNAIGRVMGAAIGITA